MANPLIRLPPTALPITDADEEVFLLYTNLPPDNHDSQSQEFRGLGHVDSRKDALEITFDLKAPPLHTDLSVKKRRKQEKIVDRARTVTVQLSQDTTALRSRKGDTGSVLWKATVDFAHAILQEHHCRPDNALFDFHALANARILELGAGTGLLSVVLSSLVRQYTVTDLSSILPLIRKNIALNPSTNALRDIQVEELDWLHLFRTPPYTRSRIYPLPTTEQAYDLILAVDCIYNPTLLQSLIETIDYHTASDGRTIVCVVMELRQEDVVREFLEEWIGKGGWEIRRVPAWKQKRKGDGEGQGFLEARYAVWVGWKGE